MEHQNATLLRIGDWCVNPASGLMSRAGAAARVEVRTMRLLLCLAEHAGEVVSIDDLLSQVWSDVTVSPDSVYQAVASLRRLLGDDPKQPTYIATVPRLGYRMVATVGHWADQSVPHINAQPGAQTASLSASDHNQLTPAPEARTIDALDIPEKTGSRPRAGFTFAVGAALCLSLALAFLLQAKLANDHLSESPAASP